MNELLVEYGIAKDEKSTGYAAGVLEAVVWIANSLMMMVSHSTRIIGIMLNLRHLHNAALDTYRRHLWPASCAAGNNLYMHDYGAVDRVPEIIYGSCRFTYLGRFLERVSQGILLYYPT